MTSASNAYSGRDYTMANGAIVRTATDSDGSHIFVFGAGGRVPRYAIRNLWQVPEPVFDALLAGVLAVEGDDA